MFSLASMLPSMHLAFQYSPLIRTTPVGVSGFTALHCRPIIPSLPVTCFKWKLGITATCIKKIKVPISSPIKIVIGNGICTLKNRRIIITSAMTATSSNRKTRILSQSLKELFIRFLSIIFRIEAHYIQRDITGLLIVYLIIISSDMYFCLCVGKVRYDVIGKISLVFV